MSKTKEEAKEPVLPPAPPPTPDLPSVKKEGKGDVPYLAKPEPEPDLRWFEVSLNCPTPLRDKKLKIQAADRETAKAAFCRHNSISDSSWEWTIEEAEAPDADATPAKAGKGK